MFSNLSQKSRITIIGAIIIASIISTPFIYAAVEPHILITMDPAQTTNPFEIKNSSSDIMFSVEPNGIINGLNSNAPNKVVLYYGQITNSTTIIAGTHDITNPIIVAHYTVVKNGSTNFATHPGLYRIMFTGAGTTTTANAIIGSFCTSNDSGTTWVSQSDMQVTSIGTWAQGLTYNNNPFELAGDETDLALCLYGTNASAGGVWSEVSLSAEIDLPVGYELTKVV